MCAMSMLASGPTSVRLTVTASLRHTYQFAGVRSFGLHSVWVLHFTVSPEGSLAFLDRFVSIHGIAIVTAALLDNFSILAYARKTTKILLLKDISCKGVDVVRGDDSIALGLGSCVR